MLIPSFKALAYVKHQKVHYGPFVALGPVGHCPNASWSICTKVHFERGPFMAWSIFYVVHMSCGPFIRDPAYGS